MPATSNLCAASRASRLRVATVGLMVAVVQMIVLAEAGAPALLWLTLAIPLSVVSFQAVQAHTGVCVAHARAGTRQYGPETEPILDPRKRQLVQQRARMVTAVALLLTAASTALAVTLVALR